MKFGSMFAGIGGIDLGLERAGMTCAWQVEIDEYCRRVLAKHWPDVPRWDDVRTFPPEDWPAEALEVEMVTAGFPCQDISVAGKGAGLEGERSGLFYEIIRVAGIIRPRFILLENVPALLARGMGTVLGELAAIGYDAEWHCVSSAAVGAPHLRDRVFIVADATGERVEGNGAAGQQVAGVPPGTEISRRDCTGTGASEWPAESGLVRMAHGVSDRVDRIKGLGNAVVPAVAEYVARCFFCERESDEIENGETGEA